MRKLARYISIYKPTHFQRIHTFKNASIHITLSFVAGILLHIPLCFQNKVTLSMLKQILPWLTCRWCRATAWKVMQAGVSGRRRREAISWALSFFEPTSSLVKYC